MSDTPDAPDTGPAHLERLRQLFERAPITGFVGHELVATAQINVNLLAPVREQDLLASANVLSAGKRLVVCRLEVTSDDDRVVAAGQATYIVLHENR